MDPLPSPQQLEQLAKDNAKKAAELVDKHPPLPASSGTVFPGATAKTPGSVAP